MKKFLILLCIILSSCVQQRVEISQSINQVSSFTVDSNWVLVQTEVYLYPAETCETIYSAICHKDKVDSVLRHQYLDAKLLEIELTK